MRVLRISHSSVVAEWRQREDGLRSNGVDVTLVTATRWHEGGADVRYEARAGRDVATSALPTIGTHPNLFAYAPGPLFRLLRAHGETVLHLVPAGAADVTVAIAPGIAVTVWPLFAVWAVAAALFAWAAWHAGGDAVRL